MRISSHQHRFKLMTVVYMLSWKSRHSQESQSRPPRMPSLGYTWPQKLDHELRCIMEHFTKLVEGQIHGQETATTHGKPTNSALR